MLVAFIVGAAAAFQYTAAVLSLRVLRVTGRSVGWMLMAGVAFLMALRRSIVLYRILSGDPAYAPDPAAELDALATSVLMALAVALIGPHFLRIRRTEEALRQRSRDLSKRVTELNCLYAFSTLVEKKGHALDEVLAAVPELVVSSMQHPQRAVARVSTDNDVYRTDGFVETGTALTCEIVASERRYGQIDVCYVTDTATGNGLLFLDEERHLLKAVAERLGRTIERVRGEDERNILQQQLHQAQKMEAVGQLAAGIAHDFSNLLIVIRGHADRALAVLEADHPARENLGIVQQATRQGTDLTRSILTFSRRVPTDKRPIEFGSIVRESCQLLCHTLPPAIDLRVDSDAEEPLWVKADQTQVQQAILTLAVNACDAMPTGGTLRIGVSRRPAQHTHDSPGCPCHPAYCACLVVADTGVGMPPEVRDRVFEPFFTTKPRGQGTGLGLAIVHGIVKNHGGQIDVVTAPGQGTTFTIQLPCVTPNRMPGVEDSPAISCRGHGELVLLTEHNQHVRGLIALTLESLGFAVLQAQDCDEAHDAAQRHRDRIRLLILDADVPERNTWDCLRKLRDGGVDVPALLISNSPIRETRELSADAVLLNKPFDMLELGNTVCRLVGSQPAREAST